MHINNNQIERLNQKKEEEYISKVCEFFHENFDDNYIASRINNLTIIDFVRRNFFSAKKYNLNQEDSILFYILLSLHNGENFLIRKDYDVYFYKIKKKGIIPDDYIFEVPSIDN